MDRFVKIVCREERLPASYVEEFYNDMTAHTADEWYKLILSPELKDDPAKKKDSPDLVHDRHLYRRWSKLHASPPDHKMHLAAWINYFQIPDRTPETPGTEPPPAKRARTEFVDPRETGGVRPRVNFPAWLLERLEFMDKELVKDVPRPSIFACGKWEELTHKTTYKGGVIHTLPLIAQVVHLYVEDGVVRTLPWSRHYAELLARFRAKDVHVYRQLGSLTLGIADGPISEDSKISEIAKAFIYTFTQEYKQSWNAHIQKTKRKVAELFLATTAGPMFARMVREEKCKPTVEATRNALLLVYAGAKKLEDLHKEFISDPEKALIVIAIEFFAPDPNSPSVALLRQDLKTRGVGGDVGDAFILPYGLAILRDEYETYKQLLAHIPDQELKFYAQNWLEYNRTVMEIRSQDRTPDPERIESLARTKTLQVEYEHMVMFVRRAILWLLRQIHERHMREDADKRAREAEAAKRAEEWAERARARDAYRALLAKVSREKEAKPPARAPAPRARPRASAPALPRVRAPGMHTSTRAPARAPAPEPKRERLREEEEEEQDRLARVRAALEEQDRLARVRAALEADALVKASLRRSLEGTPSGVDPDLAEEALRRVRELAGQRSAFKEMVRAKLRETLQVVSPHPTTPALQSLGADIEGLLQNLDRDASPVDISQAGIQSVHTCVRGVDDTEEIPDERAHEALWDEAIAQLLDWIRARRDAQLQDKDDQAFRKMLLDKLKRTKRVIEGGLDEKNNLLSDANVLPIEKQEALQRLLDTVVEPSIEQVPRLEGDELLYRSGDGIYVLQTFVAGDYGPNMNQVSYPPQEHPGQWDAAIDGLHAWITDNMTHPPTDQDDIQRAVREDRALDEGVRRDIVQLQQKMRAVQEMVRANLNWVNPNGKKAPFRTWNLTLEDKTLPEKTNLMENTPEELTEMFWDTSSQALDVTIRALRDELKVREELQMPEISTAQYSTDPLDRAANLAAWQDAVEALENWTLKEYANRWDAYINELGVLREKLVEAGQKGTLSQGAYQAFGDKVNDKFQEEFRLVNVFKKAPHARVEIAEGLDVLREEIAGMIRHAGAMTKEDMMTMTSLYKQGRDWELQGDALGAMNHSLGEGVNHLGHAHAYQQQLPSSPESGTSWVAVSPPSSGASSGSSPEAGAPKKKKKNVEASAKEKKKKDASAPGSEPPPPTQPLI